MAYQNTPAALRCEYHENPLGLGTCTPRLSWQLADDRRGARQTAYQILVASSAEALRDGQADLWDSGRVSSDTSIHIPYAGQPLSSRQRAYWTVRTWSTAVDDAEVMSSYAPVQWFELGLLDHGQWKAQWIQADYAGGQHVPAPAPFVRKTFTLNKPIVLGRLYATALGLYIPYLNGQRVGHDIFAPGWTEYRKRVQYQVYDVTTQLVQGVNCLGTILGDGWYCGRVCSQPRQFYGDRPRFLAQLEIRFADGTSQIILTDASWKFSAGPILESDMIQGESYDTRREMPGWNTAAFHDTGWRAVEIFPNPQIDLSPSIGTMVRRQEELKPVKIDHIDHGWHGKSTVVDIGQNMVGWVRLKVRKPVAGQTLTIRFAEILDKDGNLYYENLGSARATDYYTMRGDADGETFEPSFTFHGFRYVEIKGLPCPLTAEDIAGIVIHSDMQSIGSFECSEPLVNQLQHNIRWGQKGNYLEVPTDCPQRDERLGWTGDAQIFIRTGAFNYNVAPFFTKWQRDIADAQGPSGSVPAIVPGVLPSMLGGNGHAAWADAAIICPWTVYLCYGDTTLLQQNYETIHRFIDSLAGDSLGFIREHPSKGQGGFGDWLATDNGSENLMGRTPRELIGTAFYAYSTRLFSHIAGVLGKHDDARKYAALSDQILNAFVKRYVTGDGLIWPDTQTGYVLALHFDLLPNHLRSPAAEQLLALIKANSNKLTTGFVGSPYLNHVLTATGHLDMAYQLMFQKNWPSWLYAVTQGATTIWERWDGWTHNKGFQDKRMNSFNHYAYGAIGAWLYQSVAGIDVDPARPGYKHIIVRPRLAPKGVPGFTHAKASLDSMYGRIASSWKLDDDTMTLDVTIPPNTTATIHVPTLSVDDVLESNTAAQKAKGLEFVGMEEGAAVFEAGAGTYTFKITRRVECSTPNPA